MPNTELSQRIVAIMAQYKLSPSQFAERIQVQRSNVSHFTSGRNFPSFEVLQRILSAFEALSTDWLIHGKGEMLKSTTEVPVSTNALPQNASNLLEVKRLYKPQMPQIRADMAQKPNNLPPSNPQLTIDALPAARTADAHSHAQAQTHTPKAAVHAPKAAKTVSKIIIIYSDNSFDSYLQNH